MKTTDLMIGDWVIRRGVPEEPMCIYDIKASAGIAYLDQDGRGVTEKFENIEPIPLTKEILEKNEFENIPYAGIDCNKIWLLHEISYYGKSFPLHTDDIMLRYSTSEQCWCIFFNIGGVHSDFRTVTTIFYVHEFQHILKDLKINREIKL